MGMEVPQGIGMRWAKVHHVWALKHAATGAKQIDTQGKYKSIERQNSMHGSAWAEFFTTSISLISWHSCGITLSRNVALRISALLKLVCACKVSRAATARAVASRGPTPRRVPLAAMDKSPR